MLEVIRERFTGGFALVILGMLAVSFVFFGIGNFTFLNDSNAAKVEDIEISTAQLENAYQNQLLQISDYGSLPPETLQALRANVLERLIRDTLVENYVATRGYRVGNEQVAELIQDDPLFQENGVFNRDLYYQWLDNRVIDPQQFEAQQRQLLRLSQLQRGIGATAFVTPTEYRRYLNLLAEKRRASIALFDIAALAETVVIKDEDIQAYYDDRPEAYRSPESVDFEYIEISRDAIAGDINISEEELQDYYEDVTDRFQRDEQRSARHILITLEDGEEAARELAEALTARVNAGEPFADLARQYSKDGGTSGDGGSLGTVVQSQMPGELGNTIFAMDEGEVRGPVRTDFGFHVVRLDDVTSGGPLPLDDVRAELLQELRADAVSDRYDALERQMVDALFDAGDLESIAQSVGVEIKSAEGYTRSGGEPFGANEAVINTLFDPAVLNDRQISDVVEVDANRSVMVQITDYHEESRLPLEDVRDDIVFSLQSERALNMIDDRAQRLKAALAEGRDFAEVAEELEAEFTPDQEFDRVNTEVDRAVLDAIFRAKKPSPGNARLGSTMTTGGDLAVFTLNAVVAGRPESIPLAERDQRKEELQNTAGAADYNAFVNQLQQQADIERNQDALSTPEFL